jgi:uncharacterized YigZ family protein
MTYSRPFDRLHRTEIIIDKSRFITSVYRALDVTLARSFIRQISEEMPDASHHVYAYRVGFGNAVIDGFSDAGEPSGTAGPPTFAVVKGSGLGDIVLVTTRYFGGIKLGTGGLVKAYTEAAQTALADMPTELNIRKQRFLISLPYSFYETLKLLLYDYEGLIIEEAFGVTIEWIIELPETQIDAFGLALRDSSRGSLSLEPI